MSVEVALIPPVSLLDYTENQKFQLMLPDMLQDKQYEYVYRTYCVDPAKHVIMDNGAAEGTPISDEALFDLALEYLPNELVLPDRLGAMDATLEHSLAFMSQYGPALESLGIIPGYVAQGLDIEQAFNGVKAFFADSRATTCGVVYIPRLHVTPIDLAERLTLAQKLNSWFDGMVDIHFLGASKYWPREIGYIDGGIVRSIDTSLPFNYAHAPASIHSRAQIDRPEGYFALPAHSFTNLEQTVEDYLKWAR